MKDIHNEGLTAWILLGKPVHLSKRQLFVLGYTKGFSSGLRTGLRSGEE